MRLITLGTIVKTPSGRVGVVIKWHVWSDFDVYDRVSIAFSKKRSDGVVLRPELLEVIEWSSEKNPNKQYLQSRVEELCKK